MPAVDLFWDTNVFASWLYEETQFDLASIEQYLQEAKAGKWRIHTSSIVLAETLSSKIKLKKYGSILDLTNDFVGSVVMIDASANVLQLAGRLRNIPYSKNKSDKRHLSLGDATMLATALHLEDAYGVKISTFHTFDNSKKKEVPLLSYHEWCEGLKGENLKLANRICSMAREKPIHPTPPLGLGP